MVDRYDNYMPGNVAGHVENGPDLFGTPVGDDLTWSGEQKPAAAHETKIPDPGAMAVNRQIGEAVKSSYDNATVVRIVEPDSTSFATLLNVGSSPVQIAPSNPKRKTITIVNQGTNPASIGSDSGIILNGPNTVSIPAGAARVVNGTDRLFVVANDANMTTLDTQSEIYS